MSHIGEHQLRIGFPLILVLDGLHDCVDDVGCSVSEMQNGHRAEAMHSHQPSMNSLQSYEEEETLLLDPQVTEYVDPLLCCFRRAYLIGIK